MEKAKAREVLRDRAVADFRKQFAQVLNANRRALLGAAQSEKELGNFQEEIGPNDDLVARKAWLDRVGGSLQGAVDERVNRMSMAGQIRWRMSPENTHTNLYNRGVDPAPKKVQTETASDMSAPRSVGPTVPSDNVPRDAGGNPLGSGF